MSSADRAFSRPLIANSLHALKRTLSLGHLGISHPKFSVWSAIDHRCLRGSVFLTRMVQPSTPCKSSVSGGSEATVEGLLAVPRIANQRGFDLLTKHTDAAYITPQYIVLCPALKVALPTLARWLILTSKSASLCSPTHSIIAVENRVPSLLMDVRPSLIH